MNSKSHHSTKSQSPVNLIVLLTLLLFAGAVQAQESLRTVVRDVGAEWMVGKWTGTNSQGRSVSLEYEWELDGHALEIDLELGDTAYKGMILRHPTTGAVFESGADSAGGLTRATWREENGVIISERTGSRPGGQEIRVAVISKRTNADSFTATMHPLSADGVIGGEVLDTVNLKRLPTSDTGD